MINFQVNFWKLSARLLYIWVRCASVFALLSRKRRGASQIGLAALATGGEQMSPGGPRIRKLCAPDVHGPSRSFGFLEQQIGGGTPSPREDRNFVIKLMLFFCPHQRGQAKFLRILHLDNRLVDCGSQCWQPAQRLGTVRGKERVGVGHSSSEKPCQHDKCGGIQPEPKSLPTHRLRVMCLLSQREGARRVEHRP